MGWEKERKTDRGSELRMGDAKNKQTNETKQSIQQKRKKLIQDETFDWNDLQLINTIE